MAEKTSIVGTDDKGDRVKPACAGGYTFLMINRMDDSPFMMTFSGTSFSLARNSKTPRRERRASESAGGGRMTREASGLLDALDVFAAVACELTQPGPLPVEKLIWCDHAPR